MEMKYIPKLQMLIDQKSERKGQAWKQKTRRSTNITKASSLKTPPEDFETCCVIFCTGDPHVYETELLSRFSNLVNLLTISVCGQKELKFKFGACLTQRLLHYTLQDSVLIIYRSDYYCQSRA